MTVPARQPPRRSLRANIAANYASQIFVVVFGIAMTPFFLGRLGAEVYGLVGFFAVLMAWFQILDSGLSLTVARDSARFSAGTLDASSLRRLFFSLETVFVVVGAGGAVAVVLLARSIATSWLRPEHLQVGVVATSVLLMGLTAPLQLLCGLYRGAITGFERQVWLAGLNAAMAVLRLGGGAAVVAFVSHAPVVFFAYQLAVAIVELMILAVQARRVLPPSGEPDWRMLAPREVRSLLGFSGSLAFAVVAWALATQVDKLALSRILTLSSYAMFSLVINAASGVLLFGNAVSQGLLPRLTVASQSGEGEWLLLYRRATQLTCLVIVPSGLLLAFFPAQVIWAWTGNALGVAVASPILTPYALGNILVTLGAFPYYLQYARGNLRWHVAGTAGFVAILVPAYLFAAHRFGAVGTGCAWVAVNGLYLLAWCPIVHARFAPGLHWTWLSKDIAPILGVATLTGWGLRAGIRWPADRITTAALLGLVGLLLLAASALASETARASARDVLRDSARNYLKRRA